MTFVILYIVPIVGAWLPVLDDAAQMQHVNCLSVLYMTQRKSSERCGTYKSHQLSGSLLFSAHHLPACSASTPVRETLQTRWDDASSSVDVFRGPETSVTSSGKVTKFALRSKKEGVSQYVKRLPGSWREYCGWGLTREDGVHVYSQCCRI